MTKSQKVQSGFTIVELLIVIVVIGILAAITVISYSGIAQRAVAVSQQSDLSGASEQLKLYQIEYGVFPVSIDTNNCPTDTDYCLKASPGNAFQYYSSPDHQSFILTSIHTSSSAKYSITDTGAPEPVSTVAVGDNYRGGIVAAILQDGDTGYDANIQHGLIVAPTDQSTAAEWGCAGTHIDTSTGYTPDYQHTIFGTGKQNTAAIIAGCSTPGIAARIVDGLVLGGYSDWYLPSLGELWAMPMESLGFIDDNPQVRSHWWSSSEYTDDLTHMNAHEKKITDDNATLRSSLYHVRAVRSF